MNIDNSGQPKTPVLIVGAGPTGLMMASQLARLGIPFRIIEKNSGPTTQSRALVVQPRSLEIFEPMGIAQRTAEQGKIFEAINYVVNGELAKRVPLGHFGKGLTQFPYLLILEQSKTESLLLEVLAEHGHLVGRSPGKSQWVGLSWRHQARNISSSFGESIT